MERPTTGKQLSGEIKRSSTRHNEHDVSTVYPRNQLPHIMFLHHDQHVRQHRMDYETIIIVHVKINSITIHSIPFIPFVTEFFHSIQHPFHVTFSCKLQQSGFNGRSKSSQLFSKGLIMTATLQFGNHPFFLPAD